ncbi:hypothetical protein HMI54_005051 [Coelomomyces lativittatus]|nr:hypothetical protein HMI54_005051 [Coelomomyces lativittatus]
MSEGSGVESFGTTTVTPPFPYSVWKEKATTTLLRYQSWLGGFGGDVGQRPHVATTYAAVHALALTHDLNAWALIDREKMYRWFLSLKQPDGSFIMHEGGEIDLRGTYCVLTVASLLNILTPQLTEHCMSFILRCQSINGGLSAVPQSESHGGYTFCGLASAMLLSQAHELDLPRLLHWAQARQLPLEGGFQGRPSKLVDGCYTFWVGALFNLLQAYLPGAETCVDRTKAQMYLLLACQNEQKGGLMDKPGKSPDAYHTCYGLSGLSSLQHFFHFDPNTLRFQTLPKVHVVGNQSNLLNPSHPIYNIPIENVERMQQYFCEQKFSPSL